MTSCKSFITAAAMMLGALAPGMAQTMIVTTTDGQKHKFATNEVRDVTFTLASEGDFELTVSEVTAVSAKLDVVPNDNTKPYYFDVCLKSDFERYGVKAIIENYFTNIATNYPEFSMPEIVGTMCSVGPASDVVNRLPDGADMVCYCMYVDNNGKTSGTPSIVEFTTLEGGRPEDCTFSLSYTGLGGTEVTTIVHPSDPTVRYWAGVYRVDGWLGDDEMKRVVKNYIDQAVEEYGRPLEDIVDRVTFTGDQTQIESGLEVSTDYYIYAYAMDGEGNAVGPMFKETFKTASGDYSAATVSLTYRYYDGDALYAMDSSRFRNMKGKVLVQPLFTPDEITVNYAWAMAPGDMTDEEVYPEDPTKQAILMQGYTNVPTKNIVAQYGQATFLYFGADIWGMDGKITRTLVNLTPEGVSPAETYSEIDPDNPPATTSAPLKLQKRDATPESRVRMRLGSLNRVPLPKRLSSF